MLYRLFGELYVQMQSRCCLVTKWQRSRPTTEKKTCTAVETAIETVAAITNCFDAEKRRRNESIKKLFILENIKIQCWKETKRPIEISITKFFIY